MRRWVLATAMAAVVAVGLSGCVFPPTPFDGKRTAEDRIPTDLIPDVQGGDMSTSRYQGRADGWDIYLLRGTHPFGICLAYTDGTPERSGAACSGGTWVRTGVPDGDEFEVNLNGFIDTPKPGQHVLSPWVRQVRQGTGG
ncbi:hypothetical protein ABIC47_000954 [Leifsonia sp. 563]|uniref:hypothetical protein n=1 Tax=Leifsonia sp. 563 TaxID=3156412 RepID=UPI003392BD97